MTSQTILAALAGEALVGAIIWVSLVAWCFTRKRRGARDALKAGEPGAID
jgi:uncharacterized membrane protein